MFRAWPLFHQRRTTDPGKNQASAVIINVKPGMTVPRVIASLSESERPAEGRGVVGGEGERRVVEFSREVLVVVGFVPAELDITTPVGSPREDDEESLPHPLLAVAPLSFGCPLTEDPGLDAQRSHTKPKIK